MQYTELLRSLCATMTVGGYEQNAQAMLQEKVAPFFDSYRTDRFGNHIFCRLGGSPNARRLVIDAHIDEIGMLISEMNDNGFLRFVPVGGLDLRTLPSADVTVYGKEAVRGIISSLSPHLQQNTQEPTLFESSDLWIETGMDAATLAKKGVCVGSAATLYAPLLELENGVLCAPSLDNKACCAVALLAAMQARLPDDLDLFVLLSAREEMGAGGAAAAIFSLSPDAVLVLDGNLAKTQHVKAQETVALHGGPSISLSAITDRTLTQSLLDCAKEHSIPLQRIVEAQGTGTNADTFACVGTGVATAVLSLPLRHMHTPTELIASSDAQTLISLLIHYIEGGMLKWNPWTALA